MTSSEITSSEMTSSEMTSSEMTSPRQATNDFIPSQPGTYCLVLRLSPGAQITVGALGRFTFPEGFLVYIGSALGSGGLAGRLKHHTRPTGPEYMKASWHVDYLRRYTKIVEIWYVQDAIRREHEWATVARQVSGATIPAKGFGASDCNCPAHLFHYSNLPRLRAFRHRLDNQPSAGRLMVVEAQGPISG